MNELLDLITGRSIDLLRFDAGMRKRVNTMLTDAQRQLLAVLADADFSEFTGFRQRRVKALIADVNAVIGEVYGQVGQDSREHLQELASLEARFAVKSVQIGLGVKLGGIPVPDQLAALVDNTLILGAPSAEWWQRQESATQFQFTNLIRQGVIEGRTNDDLARQVRDAFKTSMRSADSLVRTSVQAVSNGARLLTYQANDDILAGFMHLSVLDGRTSEQCMARSGKRWDMQRRPIGHSIPFAMLPLHWACRSTLVPLLDEHEKIDGTQASAEGQVPANWTFADWLETKTAEQQDAILGPGKAGLWRKGTITLTDLLDQSGRPLTLEQLRARHG